MDAFRIGILLRIFEMGTVVPAGQRCGSACVFIWASGITRELGPGANLFMHCTFKEKTPKTCADQALNVRYLTSTGMPQEAINILTTSKPSDKILVRRTMNGLVKPREKTEGKSI